MEMRILGWESHGLRCPDLPINLIDGIGRHGIVSIIQMPNGTGKTTTLELLRAALSGEGRGWSGESVFQYRGPDQPEDGLFRLKLSVDSRSLVIEMQFDFISAKVSYTTISPMVGGRHDGWAPPPEVRRFLHKDFVDLIVFDGEFASNLLKADKTNAQRAVDAMSQLYLLDAARDLAEAERDNAIRLAGVKGSRATLDKTEVLIGQLALRISKIQGKRGSAVSQLEGLRQKHMKLSAEFNSALQTSSSASTRLEEAHERLANRQAEVEHSASSLMGILRTPTLVDETFREQIASFCDGLQSARLPPSTTRQFFVELAEKDECICGRELEEEHREILLQRAERFLGSEESGVLNALKQECEVAVASATDVDALTARTGLLQLRDRQESHFKALTAMRELKRELESESNRDLSELKNQLHTVKEDLEKQKLVLDEIDRDPGPEDGPDSWCLKALEQQRRQAQKKLEALTGTVEIGERTAVILDLLDKVTRYTREAAQESLVKEGNVRLERILRNSPLAIESIDRHISLRGQAGASVGQKLAVGYVMLGGLLSRGAHSLPFIVDSPANPIDNTVRREIGAMLPELCDQFVTFVISSEKEAFTSVLGDCATEAQYITVFRNLPSTERYCREVPHKGVESSERFMLVEDREFFDRFDMDEERGN